MFGERSIWRFRFDGVDGICGIKGTAEHKPGISILATESMAGSRRKPRRYPSHAETTRTQTTPTPDRELEVIIPTYKDAGSSRSVVSLRNHTIHPEMNV